MLVGGMINETHKTQEKKTFRSALKLNGILEFSLVYSSKMSCVPCAGAFILFIRRSRIVQMIIQLLDIKVNACSLFVCVWFCVIINRYLLNNCSLLYHNENKFLVIVTNVIHRFGFGIYSFEG